MCALTSFPLMVEQISKRLGAEYIMFGTSMVYFLAQALAASIVQILGYVMRRKTRISSLYAILIAMTFITVSYLCSVVADFRYFTPFMAVVLDTSDDTVSGASLGMSTVNEEQHNLNDSIDGEGIKSDTKRRDSRFGGDGEYERL